MKFFLCFVLYAGIQAHAATLSDVDQLVALLTRQLKKDEAFGPENKPPKAEPGSGHGDQPGRPHHEPDPYRHLGLPKCSYIRDHFEEIFNIPKNMAMIDKITYDPKYLNWLVSTLEMYRNVDDVDGVAILSMRRFMKLFLGDRLLCPASVFERFIMAYMRREEEMMLNTNDSIYAQLVPIFSGIPHIDNNTFYGPEDLARLASRESHRRIFNDTMEAVLYWSMSDVTTFAQWMYHWMRDSYTTIMNMVPENMPSFLEPVLRTNIEMVRCPSFDEVGGRHRHVFWEIRHGLMDLVTHELCSGVREFVEYYVPQPSSMHGEDETAYGSVLEDTCNVISDYIKEVMVRLERLESAIRTDKEPTEFISIIRPYFDETEMDLLNTVLEGVNWPIGRPDRKDLSLDDVIGYEEKDVYHWNKFLDNLTPEMFEKMTMEELVNVINNWLAEKQTRIDLYREHIGLEPVVGQ